MSSIFYVNFSLEGALPRPWLKPYIHIRFHNLNRIPIQKKERNNHLRATGHAHGPENTTRCILRHNKHHPSYSWPNHVSLYTHSQSTEKVRANYLLPPWPIDRTQNTHAHLKSIFALTRLFDKVHIIYTNVYLFSRLGIAHPSLLNCIAQLGNRMP